MVHFAILLAFTEHIQAIENSPRDPVKCLIRNLPEHLLKPSVPNLHLDWLGVVRLVTLGPV